MNPATLAVLARLGVLACIVVLVVMVELIDYLWRTRPRRRPPDEQPRRPRRTYPISKPFAPPPERKERRP